MNLNLYIDGGSRGNPGPAAAGIVVGSVDPALAIHEAGYFLGRTTNNVAEYQGLIRALELAAALKPTQVNIFSDSELLVRQITGKYRVKSPELKPLYTKATQLLLQFDSWHINHIYREANQRADELANMAMDAKRDVIVTSADAFKGLAMPATKAPAATSASPSPAAPTDEPALRWTATLTRDPGPRCPARTPAGKPFAFGPATPQGLCIHAAQAVLENGPMTWSARHKAHGQTTCPHCKVAIDLEMST